MANHTVRVTLSDDDEKFVKWLAKRDNVSFQEELRMFFYTELNECIDLYEPEMKGEQE